MCWEQSLAWLCDLLLSWMSLLPLNYLCPMVVKIPKDEEVTPLPSSVSPRMSSLKLNIRIVTLLFVKFLCVLLLLIWGEGQYIFWHSMSYPSLESRGKLIFFISTQFFFKKIWNVHLPAYAHDSFVLMCSGLRSQVWHSGRLEHPICCLLFAAFSREALIHCFKMHDSYKKPVGF